MSKLLPKLLIVESPGKLKTLRKILGSDWLLEASVGHTTELGHDGYKKLGFDLIENRVVTRYVPRSGRGKQVLSKLRAAVKKADQVYLAMDPDREGEAIAWHLVEQLKLKRYVRVSYTQITESAVTAAIQKPRALDQPLIQAQRARQCLDKLVGYEVSPLLWNTTGGKSAGRVQSATLHLICERERERLAFRPQDYWTLQAHYKEGFSARYEPAKASAKTNSGVNSGISSNNETGFAKTARSVLNSGSAAGATSMLPKGTPGKEEESGRLNSFALANKIAAVAKANPHIVSGLEDREEKRLPLPPLITSSLQQTAGVRLKFAPEKTMKIAQELYEGVGGQGLITYMRTDAVTLSPEFVAQTRSWLSANAPEVLAAQAPIFKAKTGSQAAHEAIRPTSVDLTPEKSKTRLNREQYEIYRLIWERAVASQCAPALLSRSQVIIQAAETRWVARGMRVLKPGYLKFWRNIEGESELPALQLGQVVSLTSLDVQKKTTEPPPRFSEAKLVQLMEKLGIGRPSTYASTLKTLRDRDYATIEKGALAPTPLGLGTDEFLTVAMPDLVDVQFTAQMEKSLDQIAEGETAWERFLCSWNSEYLVPALHKARNSMSGVARIAPRASGGRRHFTRSKRPKPAR